MYNICISVCVCASFSWSKLSWGSHDLHSLDRQISSEGPVAKKIKNHNVQNKQQITKRVCVCVITCDYTSGVHPGSPKDHKLELPVPRWFLLGLGQDAEHMTPLSMVLTKPSSMLPTNRIDQNWSKLTISNGSEWLETPWCK